MAKLNADGSALVFSTYLGGEGSEPGGGNGGLSSDGGHSGGLAVDNQGNVYVTGLTSSQNFPLANPIQPALDGSSDVFISKISSNGDTLLYSTYFGGSSHESGRDIAIDGDGNIYITGTTSSNDFPVTNGAFQTSRGSGCCSDVAFVTKLNINENALVYSTYLGTQGRGHQGHGIAVDSSGNAYIIGTTGYNSKFPTVNPVQRNCWTKPDAFVTKLNAIGSDLIYSTCLGGRSFDEGYGIALNNEGDVYVTGVTYSDDFPTVNALNSSLAMDGRWDGFVARITSQPDLVLTKTGSTPLLTLGDPLIYTIDVTNRGEYSTTNVILTDTLPAGVTLGSVTASQGSCGAVSPVICNLGTITGNDQATVTVMVTPNVVGGIVNVATVSANESEVTLVNNTAVATTSVTSEPTADIALGQIPSASSVIINDTFSYELKVTNNGPYPATGVTVSDTVPGQVSLISVNTNRGNCTNAGSAITCNLGTMNPGDTANITIGVRAVGIGPVVNTASVSANQPDPVTSNNASTSHIRIFPQLDLVADALEVTQGIQDLNNSVRLVAGKRTFVRFHVHSSNGTYPTTARLGIQQPDRIAWLAPINSSISMINVRPTPNRAMLDHAFLFEIPTFLIKEGPMTLIGEVNPDYLSHLRDPLEIDYTNNITSANVSFETVPPVKLAIYNVGYGTPKIYADQLHINRLVSWLKSAYPINILSWVQRSYYHGGNLPKCGDVNSRLISLNVWQKAFPFDITNFEYRYYGMVDDRGDIMHFMQGCAPTAPSIVASGPTGIPTGSWLLWDTDGSYGDWYGGHELGHAFGRLHTYCTGAEDDDGQRVDTNFPDHPNGRISPVGAGSPAALYGFSKSITGSYNIYPPSWTDVMSYCDNEWISKYTYEGLMNFFKSNLPTIGGSNLQIQNQVNRLLVVGTIDPDTHQVELNPMFIIPNVGDLEPRTPGDYAIVLRGVDGTELARHPFSVDEMHGGLSLQASVDRNVHLYLIIHYRTEISGR